MPGGRPTVVTDEVIQKLEEAFLNGASDRQACFLANIADGTLYNYIKENKEFGERKELLKQQTTYLAKMVVNSAIKANDKEISKWYLERKNKDEFSLRNELTGANGDQLKIEIINYADNSNTIQPNTENIPDTIA